MYAHQEATQDVLGSDFDAKIISMIDEPVTVKARTIRLSERLMPLFKAAAVVAIILTLSNALQVPFMTSNGSTGTNTAGVEQVQQGASVAIGDSSKTDTMQQSSILPSEIQPTPIIK